MRENDNSTSNARSGYGADGGGGGTVVAPTFISPTATPSYASPYASISPYSVAPAVGTIGTGGGLLESLVLLSALGGRGLGVNDCDKNTLVEQGCSDIRKDVADIGKEVHVLGNELQASFSRGEISLANQFRNLDNQICETDKNAIRSAYESKIASLESTNAITGKIESCCDGIKDQIFALSTNMNTQFCNTNHLIERNHADILLNQERNTNQITLQAERNTNAIRTDIKDQFCELREKSLQDTIDELRDERECHRRERDIINTGNLLSAQTTAIAQIVGSQLQRQTSDIVQFGTGNVATPLNTNTQITS